MVRAYIAILGVCNEPEKTMRKGLNETYKQLNSLLSFGNHVPAIGVIGFNVSQCSK